MREFVSKRHEPRKGAGVMDCARVALASRSIFNEIRHLSGGALATNELLHILSYFTARRGAPTSMATHPSPLLINGCGTGEKIDSFYYNAPCGLLTLRLRLPLPTRTWIYHTTTKKKTMLCLRNSQERFPFFYQTSEEINSRA